MAGVALEKDRAAIYAITRELGLAADENIDIDHDCRIALARDLSGRPGIVLIAGTGSSCYGRNAAGENWIAGGWSILSLMKAAATGWASRPCDAQLPVLMGDYILYWNSWCKITSNS